MKNVVRLYKIIIRYWPFLIAGLVFMFGFALFSGVSIMLAVPLLDYVFKPEPTEIYYESLASFQSAIRQAVENFVAEYGSVFVPRNLNFYNPLVDNLKEILKHTDPLFLLWFISISVLVLIILKNLFFYLNKVMFANLRGKTVYDIRNQMFKTYLNQSLAFFNINKVGDSLVRMVNDVELVSNFYIKSILEAIQNIVLLLVYARIALLLNSRLFLYSLILLPIFTLVLSHMGRKIKKYSRRIQSRASDLFSTVEEILNSMKIVKAFSREDHELDKFKKINRSHFKSWRKSRIYHAFSTPISEFNGTITGIVVFLIGGSQVLSETSDFTLGSFMAFLLAIFSMLHPLKIVSRAYADIRKANVSLQRISEILDRKYELIELPHHKPKKTFDDKIELLDVSFSYGKYAEVLKNISFEINKGEKVAIVGGSGAGKTTLINLLTRMYDPTGGNILIDGIPIQEIKLRDLRNLFGLVTQESILFTDTIASNINYGTLKPVSHEEIKNAAEIAYASEFIEQFPNKYDEMLDIKASNLSGGQKQRLCIARAVVGDPPILIFDEATSMLDTEAEQKVQRAIEQATKNKTVIVIAHRLSTVLSSDKIAVLDKGKITDIGSHQELLTRCDKYKKLCAAQFELKQNG